MTDDNQEDVRRVIAICFRGTEAMSDLDLERILSFDMEWLSPDEAEACVSQLIDKGWLTGDREIDSLLRLIKECHHTYWMVSKTIEVTITLGL